MAIPFKRRILRLLLVALVAMVAVIGFLPTIVGSKWIYQPLIDQLANEQFKLSIDSVRLRWFSPLRFEGIQINEADGPSLLTIRAVHTDRSLLGYLLGGRKLGRIEIEEPTISVALLKDGSNLQRVVEAIDRAVSKKEKAKPPAIDIEVLVHKMSAKVLQEGDNDPLVVVPPFDIAAQYQAASGVSRLTIQPTRILDQVKITKELIDIGLGHAIPLLAKSAWFDGRVSLDLGKVEVPLQQPSQSTANVTLTLHEVRSGPNDPTILKAIDFIGRVRGHEASHELVFIDGSVINVVVADGRVHHEGVKFGFPKMDSRFQVATHGAIGLEDKSLDLVIEIPIPIEQLAQREQVQELGVPTLQLPIKGTLDKPTIDWSAMRGQAATLLGSIKGALSDDAPMTAKVVGAMEGLAAGQADEAIAGAVDLIQQFRQRRQAKQQEQQATEAQSPAADNSEATDEATPKRNQPVRDALRDLFKKK